jgi:hypothetical protein
MQKKIKGKKTWKIKDFQKLRENKKCVSVSLNPFFLELPIKAYADL